MSSIHISNAVVLAVEDLVNPNNPRLCWRNIVTAGQLTATSEKPESPVRNLANSSTAFAWEAEDDSEQTITLNVDGQQIDFIGFARHNITGEVRISFVVGVTETVIFDFGEVPLDQSVLFLINPATPDEIRITIRDNETAPRIAVLSVGVATVLQRRLYVGHTPISYGRQLETIGSISEGGQYLGEIVRRETRTTTVDLQNITADFYREELDPFVAQRPREAAFWAWRPGDYPNEVGYVWLRGNPQPVNQRSNGMMNITLEFEGIA
jgi:hypothetical protein